MLTLRGLFVFLFALCSSAQTLNYSYDAAGRLASVTYPNGKVLSYTYDANGNLLRRLVSAPVAGALPVATAAGVLNADSFQGGAVAPGELVPILRTGIGPVPLVTLQLTEFNFVDSLISDTTV